MYYRNLPQVRTHIRRWSEGRQCGGKLCAFRSREKQTRWFGLGLLSATRLRNWRMCARMPPGREGGWGEIRHLGKATWYVRWPTNESPLVRGRERGEGECVHMRLRRQDSWIPCYDTSLFHKDKVALNLQIIRSSRLLRLGLR